MYGLSDRAEGDHVTYPSGFGADKYVKPFGASYDSNACDIQDSTDIFYICTEICVNTLEFQENGEIK